MTTEELKALVQKIDGDTATPAEKLALIKELNETIEGMRHDLAILKSNKKLKDARADLAASN